MKLWLCRANAIDFEPTGLVVAESEERASEKFADSLDNEDIWYSGAISASEVTEVEGYRIALVKDAGKLPVGRERS